MFASNAFAGEDVFLFFVVLCEGVVSVIEFFEFVVILLSMVSGLDVEVCEFLVLGVNGVIDLIVGVVEVAAFCVME